MDILLEILRGTVSLVIVVLESAMFVRAIMSWFPFGEGKFSDFLYALTEPLILPVRLLFNKMGWGTDLPIDIPFFITFLLLSFLSILV